MNSQGSQIAAITATHIRSHRCKRLANAAHRTASQGGIAIQDEMATRSSRQQAQHQTHRRAGITAIEDFRGFLKPIKTNAIHGDDLAFADRTDPNAHRPQTGRCTQGVFRRQQTVNGCSALCNRAKQERAVRNRLIARNFHATHKTTTLRQRTR